MDARTLLMGLSVGSPMVHVCEMKRMKYLRGGNRMGKSVRIHDKFQYHMEDMDCRYCVYFQCKTKPYPLEVCCCEHEKREALENGRIKRNPGAMKWDK